MKLSEIKQKIRNNIKFSTGRLKTSGGQGIAIGEVDVTLESEDLALKITIGYFRNQLKNKEFAIKLFEIVLYEFINKKTLIN
jgi:protein subunit release factor B